MRLVASILGWGLVLYGVLAFLLYLFQTRFVYFPELPTRTVEATPANIQLDFESIKLHTSDGEQLAGWYVPAPQARATLLYLHGNGGNIGHRLDQIAAFHRLGLNVLIFDYRGFGDSSGKPSEDGTYQDAQAAWDYLTQQKNISPQNILLFGESLGGAVAAWLGARQTPAALLLYASFTSMPDIAQQQFPLFPARLLVRYRYDTRASLSTVRCPVLILHGAQDEIVPYSHGQNLYAAANQPKQLLELRGGHNDALQVSQDVFVRGVDQFLQTHLATPTLMETKPQLQ